MNYGNIVNVQDSNSTNSYLKCGINSGVSIESVEHKLLNTPNFTGEIMNVNFTDEKGAIHTWGIFPFKYNEKFTHLGGPKKGQPKTEEEQFNEYLANIKHVFVKALGEENFNKVMTKVEDFKSMASTFATAVEKLPKNKFALMLINDNKTNFAKVPNWSGGFCALNAADLESKWDAAKYGTRTSTPTNSNLEKTQSTVSGEKMPWEE
jgi:hypothetical protein